ncbi:hypothetical protein O3M35_009624 [Rhynocoris fuscipes]|uniref:Polypeptide N-acetylgalactosaminyltransferase n=1 Tax=Rhynocoris fuscipes TaxID=488301 RepID=A0AAW1D6C1_9HEMI
MFLSLIPRRMIRKLWPLISLLFFMFTVFILIKQINLKADSWRSEFVSNRVDDQHDYIDSRGVRVIVGHYMASSMGDVTLTDDIINSNNFSPIPNEGKDGLAVNIPPHLYDKMNQLYHINKFNLLASDRIPLNRTLPDVRRKKCLGKYEDIAGLPKTSVIIVFHNEAWSTLLRTVWSVINRSPHSLLQEILLVDDASTRKFLGKELEDYVETLPVRTRVLRTGDRIGLIKARLLGAKQATGHILTFLDAHCECTKGWLEPLIVRVAEDRSRIVCPVIDVISDETFAYIRSFALHWGAFNWKLQFRWYTMSNDELKRRKEDLTEPFRTPAMAGGLFAMDKNYFFEIGAYDYDMKIWGGENLELSFRVWQCGGSIEIVPCSHVGHLFRKFSPYSFPGGVVDILYGNLARVALVWMDEWKEFFFKFNQDAQRLRDSQAVRSRMILRSQLHCKEFRWYLNNVWPQHFFPMEDRFFGFIKSLSRNRCLEKPTGKGILNQPMGPAVLAPCTRIADLSQMFVSPFATKSNIETEGFIATDESVCLDASTDREYLDEIEVKVLACSQSERQVWKYDPNSKNVKHMKSGLCIDLPSDESSDKLILTPCTQNSTTQQWIFISVPWR